MLLGSVKEALSYGANTFMFYTARHKIREEKPISELKGGRGKSFNEGK